MNPQSLFYDKLRLTEDSPSDDETSEEQKKSCEKDNVKPLIVLDINGVLLTRVYKKTGSVIQTPGIHPIDCKGFYVYPRPWVKEFLATVFKMADIGIATSMGKINANLCIDAIFEQEQKRKLAFIATDLNIKNIDALPINITQNRRVFFVDDGIEKMVKNHIKDYYIISKFDPSHSKSDNALYVLQKILHILLEDF
jgi:hypothetical protein